MNPSDSAVSAPLSAPAARAATGSARLRRRIATVLIHGTLLCGVVIFALPLFNMISTAFKTEVQLKDTSSLASMLIPDPVTFDNFEKVIFRVPFMRYFANSLILVVLNVTGVLVVCPLVAYGFARFHWPGRDLLFFVLLSTMMIPPQVTMVPVYLIFSELGWVNTFKPLWVPTWFGVPFYIFLLRQFFRGLPRELDEAAMIDGAGTFAVYWRILLPLLHPALVAIVLFQTVGTWNDFMGPLIYINSVPRMPLALALQSFILNHGSEWTLLFAAATLMTLPIVILFFAFQRFFVEGVTLTGMKS